MEHVDRAEVTRGEPRRRRLSPSRDGEGEIKGSPTPQNDSLFERLANDALKIGVEDVYLVGRRESVRRL